MKQQNEIKVHFHIVDLQCDPEQVSELLQVTPDLIWRKGDPIDSRLPHVRPNNGWELRSGLSKTSTLNEHAKAILEKLQGRGHLVKDIQGGAHVELSCYVHVYEYTPEMHFEPSVVRGLADAGAAIDIDYYYLIEDGDTDD